MDTIKKPIVLTLLGLWLVVAGRTTYAVDEVAYREGSSTITLPGVVVDGRQYFDVELTATSTSGEFVVTRAEAASQPGAVSFSSATGRLIVPSLRYQSGSTTTRYSVEFALAGQSPIRLRLTSATPTQQTYTDSTAAASVAAWLRAAPPADNASSHFEVLGVQAFNGIGNLSESIISARGPSAFYESSTALQEATNTIVSRMASAGPAMQAGGITTFRDVQTLPWGMIEPSQGQYNFTLMDTLVQNYQAYGLDYVAVGMPYASWDLSTRSAAASACQRLLTEDFKYLAAAGKMDRYVNVDAFVTMLQTAVERYDGDGVNDMAGLLRPVRYWQIHNEPEGENCGLFRGDAASFLELMRKAHTAVKAACADCQVINAGAGLVDRAIRGGGTFWWDYAALGGGTYIDTIAIHFNDGKDPGTQDVSLLETRLTNIKDALGSAKPIWVTEFGVIVNAPPGSFVSLTEVQAASWFIRFYTAGLNGGVTRFFSDAQTFFATTGRGTQLLLPYYTNKLMEAKIGGFTASTRVAAGQYRFTVGGRFVYVLWSGVPADVTGTVTSYDLYGNETVGDARNLAPTQDSPLIVVTENRLRVL